MTRFVLALAAMLLLAGCEQPAPQASRRDSNPDKYARDRDLCRAQVDELMRSRRNVDDSRRDVLAGDTQRYGQNMLPDQMAAYGDTRSADRVMASCMEARGWPQPQKAWWQKIGS